MIRRTGLLLAIFALSACRVEDSTRPGLPELQGPSLGISDGTVPGGNDEFFFYPPLAANPSGHPNVDAGAFNPFLEPYAIICRLPNPLNQHTATSCEADVSPVAGGIPLKLTGETYSDTWKTSESMLSSNRLYRIEVFSVPVPDRVNATAEFIATYRYGYRDIDPDNGPSVSACTTEPFCKIQNGSNIALKVRIERFASCPETRACESRFVSTNQTTNLVQPSGNRITIPSQSANFFLNFDVCSAAEEAAVDAAVDIPTVGPCFKTETPFTGQLSTPAILSICETIDFVPVEYQGQDEQIALHHFHTENGTLPITRVEALPEANSCQTLTGDASSGNVLGRLARAVARNITSFMNPQPLHAAVALDVGGGGFLNDFSSLFKLALPGKGDYVNAADAYRTAPPGSDVTLQAKVTDLVGAPIAGATVNWAVQSSPGTASLSASQTTTDANGLAQVVLTLPRQTGTTVVYAAGKGIADARNAGCTVGNNTNASCNGPRTGADLYAFDPFIPRNHHLEPTSTLGPVPVPIATGTRLEFVVVTGRR
ncbi:MAG TPA: Ig-like domain-containing protein [Gemmatimonadaceae bacterium]